MSCPYYYWDKHYACRKTNKDINEDVYYKYCRNYDYADCPMYRGKQPYEREGCYLTSACVVAKGLPDDCYELQTLRSFRDTYLKARKNGAAEIEHYYQIAPLIVDEIMKQESSRLAFERLYENLVLPCVTLIDQERYDEAYWLYRTKSLELERIYLNSVHE